MSDSGAFATTDTRRSDGPARAEPSPAPPTATAPSPPSPDAVRRAMLERTPRVRATPAVAGLAVLAWLLTSALGAGWWPPSTEGLLRLGANYAPRTLGSEWWRLFTATFLHDGPLHLALNLLVLWAIGPFVERLVGSAGFLVVYVLSGLFGGLATTLLLPQAVTVGASGAIFGLYGATLGFFLVERRRLPAVLLGDVRKWAGWFLGFNLLFGISHPRVAWPAYLGGFVGGMGLGALLAQPVSARGLRLHARNLAVAAVGLALVVLGLTRLPRRPDLIAEERAFVAAEARGVDAYNGAVMRWNRHELKDAQLADLLEHEVLPAWRAERARLDRVLAGKLSSEDRARFDRFARYLRARDEGWVVFTEGLRATDVEKTKRGADQQREAEKLLKDLSASPH